MKNNDIPLDEGDFPLSKWSSTHCYTSGPDNRFESSTIEVDWSSPKIDDVGNSRSGTRSQAGKILKKWSVKNEWGLDKEEWNGERLENIQSS